MNILVLYQSRSGHTRSTAEAIAHAASTLGHKVNIRSVIEVQKADIESMRRDEQRRIPDDIDYDVINGLSNEMRQKLTQFRPQTIAQAQALDGMTPAALTLLLAVIKRGDLRKAS